MNGNCLINENDFIYNSGKVGEGGKWHPNSICCKNPISIHRFSISAYEINAFIRSTLFWLFAEFTESRMGLHDTKLLYSPNNTEFEMSPFE